jgi:hypothetical protein
LRDQQQNFWFLTTEWLQATAISNEDLLDLILSVRAGKKVLFIDACHAGAASGDAEQEYFADGISEDIITALSKLSQLFVIARNSSFTFKGKNVHIGEVGSDRSCWTSHRA